MRGGGSGEDVDLFDIGDSDSGPGLCHCYFYFDNFTLKRVTPILYSIYMMERVTPIYTMERQKSDSYRLSS